MPSGSTAPYGMDLREPERGLGHRVRVAVAARAGRGLRVAAARALDVARRERRLGEREHRRAALRRGRLGAEGDRLERLRVVRRGLGVPERRGGLARGLERRLPGGLRVRAGARGGQRVVGDLRRGDVGARVAADDQRGGHRLVDRAAPLLGQRLADGVADDPVREARSARPARRQTRPDASPRSTAAAAAARGTPAARDEVGDREAPGDRADLEHRARLVAEPLDAPAHDFAHARGHERAAGRVVVGPVLGREQPDELGDVERVAARAAVDRRRRSAARPRRAAARGRPRARARPARPARRASRPRSPRAPPGTRPRPRCRRPRRARARPSRRATTCASSRSEDASAQCRSSSTTTQRRVGRGDRQQVGDGVVELQALLLAARAGDRAEQRGRARGRDRPATRPVSARTTGRQTPYGRPSASPRPRTATPPRLPASLASASSRVVLPIPDSPATTTVRTVPLHAWVSTLRRRSSSGPRPTTPAGASTSSVGAGDQAVELARDAHGVRRAGPPGRARRARGSAGPAPPGRRSRGSTAAPATRIRKMSLESNGRTPHSSS